MKSLFLILLSLSSSVPALADLPSTIVIGVDTKSVRYAVEGRVKHLIDDTIYLASDYGNGEVVISEGAPQIELGNRDLENRIKGEVDKIRANGTVPPGKTIFFKCQLLEYRKLTPKSVLIVEDLQGCSLLGSK